ncbi:MAG: hypothetical protein V3V08_18295 [Nannocystaceae bacterium]
MRPPSTPPVARSQQRHAAAHHQQLVLFAATLGLLWLLYSLNRVIPGYEFISDERFFLTMIPEQASKRRLFMRAVQLLEDENTALLLCGVFNLVCMVAGYVLLTRINLGRTGLSFLQTIYFCAIGAYLLRDCIIFLLVMGFTTILFSPRSRLITGRLWELRSWRGLWSAVLLLTLLDFRPHYTVFLLIALGVTLVAVRIKENVRLFAVGAVSVGALLMLASDLSERYFVYGVTVAEYLDLHQARVSMDLTPSTFIVSLSKHYLAPMPTSLLARIALDGGSAVYGALDDVYRLIYKVSLYCCMFYVGVNVGRIPAVYSRWRARAVFLTTFSVLNATLYSGFSFGGGHERTKIFSTLFIFFLAAGLRTLELERQSRARLNYLQGLRARFQ